MASTVNMLIEASQGDVWIECKPVMKETPKDDEKLQNIANKYMVARLLSVSEENDAKSITDWFQIPKSQFFKTIPKANGPVCLQIDDFSDERIDTLFEDVTPTFTIDDNKSVPSNLESKNKI